MISVRFQGKPFTITVIQVYGPTTDTREADIERFYDDLQELLELAPKKDVLFIIQNWNAKGGSQEITGVTGKCGLGVQNGAGQRVTVLPLVIANTLFQKHEMTFTWTSPDGQYRNQIDYVLCSQRGRSSRISKNRTGS